MSWQRIIAIATLATVTLCGTALWVVVRLLGSGDSLDLALRNCENRLALCPFSVEQALDSDGIAYAWSFRLKNEAGGAFLHSYDTAMAHTTQSQSQSRLASQLMNDFVGAELAPASALRKFNILGSIDAFRVHGWKAEWGDCGEDAKVGKWRTSQPKPDFSHPANCLARRRAVDLAAEFEKSIEFVPADELTLAWSTAPFLNDVDERLYGALNEVFEIDALKHEILIASGAGSSGDGPDGVAILEYLERNRTKYDRRFRPFRSGLFLTVRCSTARC